MVLVELHYVISCAASVTSAAARPSWEKVGNSGQQHVLKQRAAWNRNTQRHTTWSLQTGRTSSWFNPNMSCTNCATFQSKSWASLSVIPPGSEAPLLSLFENVRVETSGAGKEVLYQSFIISFTQTGSQLQVSFSTENNKTWCQDEKSLYNVQKGI